MLSQSGLIDALVEVFRDPLADHGYRLPTGTLVESSVVQVPRHRNSREGNTVIKSGGVPIDWNNHPNKLCQKETEARWFKKHGVSHFGYKNHIAVDRATKLITHWEVSAVRAYRSKERFSGLRKKGFTPRITYKARRGRPLRLVRGR